MEKYRRINPELLFQKSNLKKTGMAGIFSATLEMAKEGKIDIIKKRLFDKLLIKKNAIMKNKKKKINILDFPKNISKNERKVEAILFSAVEPLRYRNNREKTSNEKNISKILEKLQYHYKSRGINLVCIKGKWSFRTSEDLSKTMALQKSTQKKLSKATVETLAIIVYHQPVTRSEIEEIRGVAFATNTLEILLELNWVRPGGRKDVPGKPIQYVTTEDFLNHFNIQKLSDLPTIEELSSAGLIDTANVDNSIFGTVSFFKEQSISEKKNIYSDIENAIDEAPKVMK